MMQTLKVTPGMSPASPTPTKDPGPYEVRDDISWALVVDTRDGEIVSTFKHTTYVMPGLSQEMVRELARWHARADAKARNDAVNRENAMRARFALSGVPEQHLSCGELKLDLGRRIVQRAGEVVQLTVKEYEMLAVLMRDPERVFERRDLGAAVWGEDFPPTSRTLDAHASRLRQKLGGNYVHNVRGVGYSLIKPVPADLR